MNSFCWFSAIQCNAMFGHIISFTITSMWPSLLNRVLVAFHISRILLLSNRDRAVMCMHLLYFMHFAMTVFCTFKFVFLFLYFVSCMFSCAYFATINWQSSHVCTFYWQFNPQCHPLLDIILLSVRIVLKPMHYSIAHLSHTCALKLVPDQHNAAAIQGFGFWRQFVKLYCGNYPLSLLRWKFLRCC